MNEIRLEFDALHFIIPTNFLTPAHLQCFFFFVREMPLLIIMHHCHTLYGEKIWWTPDLHTLTGPVEHLIIDLVPIFALITTSTLVERL